jgi:hypothetical protein
VAYEDMARSHVRQLLRDGMELTDVVVDGDGDVPFRHGTAMYYVSVVMGGRMARVWSNAVYGVKDKGSVLREINSTNEALVHSRAFIQGATLVVEAFLPLDSLEADYLTAVCFEVGTTADRLGQLIATVHGGSVTFDDEDVEASG